jgi:hypothetical protein
MLSFTKKIEIKCHSKLNSQINEHTKYINGIL